MIRAHQATMAIIAVHEMTLKYLICIVRQEVRGYQTTIPQLKSMYYLPADWIEATKPQTCLLKKILFDPYFLAVCAHFIIKQ